MSPPATTDDFWALRFAELQEYKAEHGHCNVPYDFKDNPQLVHWVRNNRCYYKNFMENNGKGTGGINPKKIKMLEEIGFCWTVGHVGSLKRARKSTDAWMVQFAALKHYKAKHGHCNVPDGFKENPTLGSWVNRQRWFYKNLSEGRDGACVGTLNQERINILEGIGFRWSIAKERETDWQAQFTKLKDYKEKHGDCNVPKRFKEPKLAYWVAEQRRHYKSLIHGDGKRKGNMNQEHIDLLDEIGFCWSLRKEKKKLSKDIWMVRYEELKDFKEEHGHCNVPHKFKLNRELGKWVRQQRFHYKNLMDANGKPTGCMNQERIDMLEEIGFCWFPLAELATNWMVRFAELKDYKAKHGHCNVPAIFKTNLKLGFWVHHQRAKGKKFLASRGEDVEGMNQERFDMMEEIGFCWSAAENPTPLKQRPEISHDDDWVAAFVELKDYEAEHGHCNVPYDFAANQNLGRWVHKQRSLGKKFMAGNGKSVEGMNEDRIEMLEEIGFCWSAAENIATPQHSHKNSDDDWVATFSELKDYNAEHGHCNVPYDFPANPNLGRWVCQQRVHYKKFIAGSGNPTGCMNQDRFDMLEGIGLCLSVDRQCVQEKTKRPDDDWMVQFAKLKEYKASHGHCNVPSRFRNDLKLGNWVGKQRLHYNNFVEDNGGEIGNMNQETIDMLEAIGFCWSIVNDSPKSAKSANNDWMIQFAKLKNYKAKHGHCNVPQKFKANPKLGKWVKAQRLYCTNFMEDNGKQTGGMNQARLTLLKEIGFCWSVSSNGKKRTVTDREPEDELIEGLDLSDLVASDSSLVGRQSRDLRDRPTKRPKTE